ncbi:recombinase family protein [Candidatus Peregrinibacteria bacterium]|nr:recombinase family protein [Candidatus Peregrinibacteria bacterium]
MTAIPALLEQAPHTILDRPSTPSHGERKEPLPDAPIRYCLYARKSSEDDERQALSIDSQIKEMMTVAKRDGLDIVEIRRESHSAKDSGQRPVFSQLLTDIRSGTFTGIVTWAPDRLSRNAGDLGSLVDLMDQGVLKEIRTTGQKFTNSPNEKFLLMILCSQAKLENDNRGINVKRGLKNKCEMGVRPGVAPLGYLNERSLDRNKGRIVIDPIRAPTIRQLFRFVAERGASGRTLLKWLNTEANFKTRGDKRITLSGVYRILGNPFYYGMFEYPKGGDNWYKGTHEPIITKELFEEVRAMLAVAPKMRYGSKEFAFTKMLRCGNCGNGVTAEEKFKQLRDGTIRKYVYYHCSRFDQTCKQPYVREDELLNQLLQLIDQIDLDKTGMRKKLQTEVEKMNKFTADVLGMDQSIKIPKMDVRGYAKYVLKNGTTEAKRDILGISKNFGGGK